MKKVVSYIALSLAFLALGVLLGRSTFAENSASPQEQAVRPDRGMISAAWQDFYPENSASPQEQAVRPDRGMIGMAWIDFHRNLRFMEENAAFLPQDYREDIAEQCFTQNLGGMIESAVLVSVEKGKDREGHLYIAVMTDKDEKLFFRFSRFPLEPCDLAELWKNSLYSDEGGEILYIGFLDEVIG